MEASQEQTNTQLVKILLEAGADPNLYNKGRVCH
jgi:hypothetical protein